MAELEGVELRTGRADRDYWRDSGERIAEARAAVAAVLATEPRRIALTHATTEGMNVATWAIDWQPGDRAVTTSLEHPGALGPLWVLRERRGVDLAVADIGTGADPDAVLEALDRVIVGGTRLVVAVARLVGHGRSPAGGEGRGAGPLARGAGGRGRRAVRRRNPGRGRGDRRRLLLGARPEVAAGAGGHRRAVLLAHDAGSGAPDLRRLLQLRIDEPGGRRASSGRRRAGSRPSGFHQPSILGFARSAAWLSMFVGLAWIHERTARLAAEAAAMLAEIPGVEVITPRDRMAGLISFRIAGWSAEAALRGTVEADLLHRPNDPAAGRDPDQRRLLQHGRGAAPLLRRRGAAGGPHAGDDAAPPQDRSPARRRGVGERGAARRPAFPRLLAPALPAALALRRFSLNFTRGVTKSNAHRAWRRSLDPVSRP